MGIDKNCETGIDIEKLYFEYKKDIYGFFYFRTKDEYVSEDLTQETFINVCRYEHQIKDIKKVKYWVFKIAQNIFNAYYKKHKKELNMIMRETNDEGDSILEFIPSSESITETLIKAEDYGRLKLALEQLSKEEKMLIQFRFFEQRSFQDIVLITGMKESTIKSKLYRSFEKCRKIYEKLEGMENDDEKFPG